MTEKFEIRHDAHSDGIIIPSISNVEVDRQDDKHKPSIFDIEGALKIIGDEEDGIFPDEENEPTLH